MKNLTDIINSEKMCHRLQHLRKTVRFESKEAKRNSPKGDKRPRTQQELADELHVSRDTIIKWESIEKEESVPDVHSLLLLADMYGVSVDYLLGLTDYSSTVNEQISEITGLSDAAVEMLRILNNTADADKHLQEKMELFRAAEGSSTEAINTILSEMFYRYKHASDHEAIRSSILNGFGEYLHTGETKEVITINDIVTPVAELLRQSYKEVMNNWLDDLQRYFQKQRNDGDLLDYLEGGFGNGEHKEEE